MTAYVIRRLFAIVPTLWLVLTIVFFLIRLIPGDPAAIMLGPDASPKDIERLRHILGLDRPLVVQYLNYLSRVFKGDLGMSTAFHIPVTKLIFERVETSFLLATLSAVIVLCLGGLLGILAAVKCNTWIDQLLLMFAVLAASVPSFWLGLLLIWTFAVRIPLFPTSGFVSVFKTGDLANLRYLVLPSITLGFVNSALLARITRSSMLEVLQEDYIKVARSKGLRESRVIITHALRNAAIPIITVFSFSFAGLMSAAVVTETVFALPGIGRLVVETVLRRDYPTIQGLMIFISSLYLFINLLTDLMYGFLDPRIRY